MLATPGSLAGTFFMSKGNRGVLRLGDSPLMIPFARS
jgi:hypothetical protein